MAYDPNQTDPNKGRGALFGNDKKTEAQPDLKGSIDLSLEFLGKIVDHMNASGASAIKLDLAAWMRVAASGTQYYSVQATMPLNATAVSHAPAQVQQPKPEPKPQAPVAQRTTPPTASKLPPAVPSRPVPVQPSKPVASRPAPSFMRPAPKVVDPLDDEIPF